MDEKGTMTATFEPTLDVYKLLEGKPTEYVVVNPVTIEARFKDGDVMRYPQEIRERVTRCRNCIHYSDEIGGYCELLEFANTDMADGFCAWGSPRKEQP